MNQMTDDECPNCGGSGDHDETPEDCPKCNGTGMYYENNVLLFEDSPDMKNRREKAEKDIGKKLNEQEPVISDG